MEISKTTKIIGVVTFGALLGLGTFFLIQRQHNSYKLEKIKKDLNIIPVVVIGSGPAGLTAAVNTARAKYTTVVFMGESPLGQLNLVRSVENWPGKPKISGSSIMKELEEQAKGYEVEFVPETIEKVRLSCWPFELISNKGKEYHALSIIIATGLEAKKPNIPGIKEYWGHGVGSCAICESSFNEVEDAVIIGNGKYAAELVLNIVAHAHQVTVVVREPEFNVPHAMLKQIKSLPNVAIMTNSEAIRINGDHGVSSVTVKNLKTHQQKNIPAKLVLCSIGFKPLSDLFKNYVELDSKGYIKTKGRSQRTSRKGVFAAGTVEDRKYGKASIAAAAGAKAAFDAITFLESIGFNTYKAEVLQDVLYHIVPHDVFEIPIISSQSEFEKKLKQAHGPVVADFFMPTCPACIRLMPHFEAVARKHQDGKDFVKVDVSKDRSIATNLSITSVPKVIIFNKGTEAKRCEPAKDEKDLKVCMTQAGV